VYVSTRAQPSGSCACGTAGAASISCWIGLLSQRLNAFGVVEYTPAAYFEQIPPFAPTKP
jgi:hypothetical protein